MKLFNPILYTSNQCNMHSYYIDDVSWCVTSRWGNIAEAMPRFSANFMTKPTLMPQRFLQEESATLEAMKALLQGRSPTMAKGTVQPICDEQVEKPQRVTGCQ